MSRINFRGVWAIYRYELSRTVRTIWQSVATPVITTALYFVVFGGAIGSRIREVDSVSYGAFIVPGLIILATATLFVDVRIDHPLWMVAFLILTSVAFSLFGFIIGIWARNFEQLAIIPALIVTPLTFLGGAFYSINILPPFWRAVSLFNPVVYLISGFRWSFYGQGDVSVAASLGFTALFIVACLAVLVWIFRTGWRLKP